MAGGAAFVMARQDGGAQRDDRDADLCAAAFQHRFAATHRRGRQEIAIRHNGQTFA